MTLYAKCRIQNAECRIRNEELYEQSLSLCSYFFVKTVVQTGSTTKKTPECLKPRPIYIINKNEGKIQVVYMLICASIRNFKKI